ncbi:FAD binding domain-containing protein [Longispora albida]|uniref:FAD binding domain-containing protein n=1 Tax=Longispora albida TaxID=203523 RepID=UPI000368A69E|nr:FAD binding domain-containing protein [Longispora albida]
MEFFRPLTWEDALAALAAHPDALPVAGGTDVMVDLNFARKRPPALLDLTRVPELAGWAADGPVLRIGAGVTYEQIISGLGDLLPGLAMASRTVGSPQIRNRGTVGGNLATGSPAGDAHPPLLATGASVELASARGTRVVPVDQFFLGPKRTVMEAGELIAAFLVEPAKGPQQFAKVGTRNSMVIAVCSLAVALDEESRTVGTGIGSAAPTPRRAVEAERFAAEALPWDGGVLADATARRFGELVAAASDPIDDVRGSAAYRRHALAVLGARALRWAWEGRR